MTGDGGGGSAAQPSASSAFVLGVDLDGVCGDYTTAFGRVVGRERGIDPSQLEPDRSWNFDEWGLAEVGGFDRLHRVAVLEHRMFLEMPVMPGCADALWRLSDAGVWIRIITHRLCVNWGHAVAVSDTVAWLDRHDIPYRDLCFLGDKPQVGADCYVDDSPTIVESLRAAGSNVIVFDAPYNAGLAGPRAETWREVEDHVAGLAAAAGVPLQVQLPGLGPASGRLRARLAP
ncbi:MAG: 5' nucleotidase, NT5C type [Acidimicrobiia bacterium]